VSSSSLSLCIDSLGSTLSSEWFDAFHAAPFSVVSSVDIQSSVLSTVAGGDSRVAEEEALRGVEDAEGADPGCNLARLMDPWFRVASPEAFRFSGGGASPLTTTVGCMLARCT